MEKQLIQLCLVLVAAFLVDSLKPEDCDGKKNAKYQAPTLGQIILLPVTCTPRLNIPDMVELGEFLLHHEFVKICNVT